MVWHGRAGWIVVWHSMVWPHLLRGDLAEGSLAGGIGGDQEARQLPQHGGRLGAGAPGWPRVVVHGRGPLTALVAGSSPGPLWLPVSPHLGSVGPPLTL